MPRFATIGTCVALAFVGQSALAALTTFDSFNAGSVDGQGGWNVSNAALDQAVVDLGGGNKVLRLSNAVTSGGFGDQTFAPRPGGTGMTPADPVAGQGQHFAGEASTGALYNRFVASFDVRSVSTEHIPGLFISISPDNGQGGRQGYVGLQSTASGIEVIGYTVTTAGAFQAPDTLGTYDFDEWFNVRYEIDFLDGPDNDVARVYLDDNLVYTTNSWEQYYSNWQAALHPNGVPVQTLLFRAGGTAAPAASGAGFYFDNVDIELAQQSNAVPAPGGLALAGIALLGLAFSRRMRAV